MSVGDENRIHAYHAVGPAGPLLWYMLSSFKREFVRRLREKLLDDQAAAGNWLDAAKSCVQLELTELTNGPEGQERLAKAMLAVWPEELKKDSEVLAVARSELLVGYLRECVDLLGRAREAVEVDAAQAIGQSDARRQSVFNRLERIEEALTAIFWPYYFLRLPKEAFSDDHVITWIPGLSQLCMPIRSQRSSGNRSIRAGDLIYPSLVGLFRARQSSDPLIAKLEGVLDESRKLGRWLGHSMTDVRYQRTTRIGHVQKFEPFTEGFDFKRDLQTEGPKSSRFSDAFYGNAEAFYVDESGEEETDAVTGRLILCSPVRGLLPLLTSALIGKTNKLDFKSNSHFKQAASQIRKTWTQCGAAASAVELGRSLQRTESIFQRQQETGAGLAFSFMSHNVIGSLCKRFSPPDEISLAVHYAHQLVSADVQAASGLAGNQVDLLKWSSGSVSYGRMIETALSGFPVKVRVNDDELMGSEVDPRFVSLVHELVWNACRHSPRSVTEVTLAMTRRHQSGNGECVTLKLVTEAFAADPERMARRLSGKSSLSGIVFVTKIANQLAAFDEEVTPSITWAFKSGDGPQAPVAGCMHITACPRTRELAEQGAAEPVELRVSSAPLRMVQS